LKIHGKGRLDPGSSLGGFHELNLPIEHELLPTRKATYTPDNGIVFGFVAGSSASYIYAGLSGVVGNLEGRRGGGRGSWLR